MRKFISTLFSTISGSLRTSLRQPVAQQTPLNFKRIILDCDAIHFAFDAINKISVFVVIALFAVLFHTVVLILEHWGFYQSIIDILKPAEHAVLFFDMWWFMYVFVFQPLTKIIKDRVFIKIVLIIILWEIFNPYLKSWLIEALKIVILKLS
jgi:hypothetical protein